MALYFSKKKSRKKEKEPDAHGIKLLIAFILVLILTAFIHFREVKVEFLELGSSAKNYVVAQVDFSFPDQDATMILRGEALRDIGKIYRIAKNDIFQAKHEFQEYLIGHPGWRKKVSDVTFDQLYNALDAIVQTLEDANLTDARTYKKREESGLSNHNVYIVYPIDAQKPMVLPERFWEHLETYLNKRYGFTEKTLRFILDFFEEKKWTVYNDIESQKLLRESIEQSIPDKFTRIKAGNRIIDQGEKVSTRHLSMLAAMKRQLSEERNLWAIATIMSSLLFSVILTFIGGLFFYFYDREFIQSERKLALFVTTVAILLAFSKFGEWFLLDRGVLMEMFRYPLFVPLLSVLLSILIGTRVALFSTFVFTIVTGVTLAVNHNFYLFINMIVSIVALVAAKDIKKRKEVFVVCFKMWIAMLFVIFALNLGGYTLVSRIMLYDLVWSIINIVILAILLIGLIPILESIFGVLTDMVLMEFMDPTNPLLKRLSIEAPGTYQHSLSIGHISEYVANAIGANGLFCRVTTLYHDIGKLNTPHYYTENQSIDREGSFNIHQLLTPIESAYIIKSHVMDGEMLAKEYRLPQPFIDIIRQHHGTTLIKYFYLKQLEDVGGKEDEVDQSAFRYPGPKPQTKESMIIMLADAVEAISRSLESNDEASIRGIVDQIVRDRFEDGQFDSCPLTFQELSIVKAKFVEMIKATHHLRIKYPKKPEKKEEN